LTIKKTTHFLSKNNKNQKTKTNNNKNDPLGILKFQITYQVEPRNFLAIVSNQQQCSGKNYELFEHPVVEKSEQRISNFLVGKTCLMSPTHLRDKNEKTRTFHFTPSPIRANLLIKILSYKRGYQRTQSSNKKVLFFGYKKEDYFSCALVSCQSKV
jgi:hypothetical protein